MYLYFVSLALLPNYFFLILNNQHCSVFYLFLWMVTPSDHTQWIFVSIVSYGFWGTSIVILDGNFWIFFIVFDDSFFTYCHFLKCLKSIKCSLLIQNIWISLLTHFKPLISFDTLWKHPVAWNGLIQGIYGTRVIF